MSLPVVGTSVFIQDVEEDQQNPNEVEHFDLVDLMTEKHTLRIQFLVKL